MDLAELSYAQRIQYKSREVNKLRNRIYRYQTRLIKEAWAEASSKKITVTLDIIPSPNQPNDSNVPMQRDYDDDEVNIRPLIELTKSRYPSLYRRYNKALTRFNTEYSRLEEMVKEFA